MLIVKKMPILQGFPDFETVKNLSGKGFLQDVRHNLREILSG